MRGLTKKERRAVELELNSTGYDKNKLRIIVDCKNYEGIWLVGLTIMDDAKSQRIVIPQKSAPSVDMIIKQLAKLAPTVSEVM